MPSFACTVPVNPPGASPVLTAAQVWRGLEEKARRPERFVESIEACTVERDEGDKLTRTVRFKNGPEVREEIQAFKPCIVYFEMTPLEPPPSSSSAPPSPVRITNLISHSPTNDLMLTFSFAPRMPHLPDEVIREKGWGDEDVNREIGRGIQRTVDVIREMVRNGEIQ